MSAQVNSYRFLEGMSRRMIKTWIAREEARPIPWTPLTVTDSDRPLSACTVALVSSGGIALKTDRPFDQEAERRNPWWGDPSYRVIPRTATADDVRVYHLHINPVFAEQDLNCLLPLERLLELEAQGKIGASAPSHYSFMGYTMQPQALLEESAPAIARQMQSEGVDVALLVPA